MTEAGVADLLESSGLKMKENLAEILEHHLDTLAHPSIRGNLLKVADIVFAYENGKLVKLLMKRGDAIKGGNKETINAVNRSIEAFVANA